MSLTGEIQPRYQADLGFRVGGKILERPVDVGTQVKKGELLARLDPQQYRQDFEVAKAEVAKADAEVSRSQAQESRQRQLLKNGHTTQVNYDQALKTFKTAEAQANAVRAKQVQASENLGYTDLEADAEGVISAIGAEPGQVVSAGQMVVRLAQPGEREAVFNVAEAAFKNPQKDPTVAVRLVSDPEIKTEGKVRYVSPQADPDDPHLYSPGFAARCTAANAARRQCRRHRHRGPGAGHHAPGHRALRQGRQAGGVARRRRPYRAAEADHGGALSGQFGRRRLRADTRRDRRHRRRAKAGSRRKSAADRGKHRTMTGFNLSEWAIHHRSFVWFMMIAFVVAGVLSYSRLGREEDPAFTIKTMIVQAQWPGATIEDMMLQVTDRIEKKLQETPSLYYLKSYTKPGVSTIYVNLLDTTPKSAVPEIWYQVRKKVADIKGTLPQGVVGPSFNDEFGDVFGIIYAFTADGFTKRELRDYVEEARTEILTVKNAAKAQLIGAQDQKILSRVRHQATGRARRQSRRDHQRAARAERGRALWRGANEPREIRGPRLRRLWLG